MPSSQSHGNQQRRIFRGKGGATDGRLPPKKSHRIKVKYQPNNSEETGVNDRSDAEEDLSIDVAGEDYVHNGEEQPEPIISQDDDILREMKHLQKRIHNIQTSLQTSQGISNPRTWYSNCLLPVKNAMKEWRSICKFHLTDENKSRDNCITYEDIIHETSVQAFNLLQMAMQSGPLIGSNPGYFKRCGSEVAAIALMFLNEIVDLAGVHGAVEKVSLESEMCTGETNNATYDVTEHQLIDNAEYDKCDLESNIPMSAFGNLEIGSSSSSSIDESSRSGSSTSTPSVHELPVLNDHDSLASRQDTSSKFSNVQMVNTLQSAFLFSENQTLRLCQWMENARKAVQANKAPSKSAKKLQDQKSKKQKVKELKMARKLKKKKKGGGK